MRGRVYRIGPGASSLLLILLTLALTALGMLALLSARADHALSVRARDLTQAYYGAKALSQERLAELDALLAGAEASGAGGYFVKIEQTLPDWAEMGDRTITFSQGAGGERAIRVTIALSDPGADGARYEIVECALIDEMEWEPEPLDLM